ncbi:hypothetical protein WI81_17125 [Burkholderia ubonensis]|nr:hypothetical protein WI81_17125 [Burkholderia ubonensis]
MLAFQRQRDLCGKRRHKIKDRETCQLLPDSVLMFLAPTAEPFEFFLDSAAINSPRSATIAQCSLFALHFELLSIQLRINLQP